MSLANFTAYKAAMLSPHQNRAVSKSVTVSSAGASQRWWSSWTLGGSPAAGTAPAGSVSYTNATTGALAQSDPLTELRMFVKRISLQLGTGIQPVTLLIYDRICSVGGLVGNVTTSQTVATPSVTRWATATDRIMPMWEVFSSPGSTTGPILTMGYTNQAGTAGQTMTSLMSSTLDSSGSVFRHLSLASGDVGVQSVDTITLSASFGIAGNCAITLIKPLLMLPILGTEEMAGFDPVERLGALLPKIPAGACLSFAVMAPVTGTYILNGDINFLED